MSDALVGFAAIAIGAGLIRFRDAFARFAMAQQSRAWGFRVTSSTILITKMVSTLVGIGFVAVGAIAVMGVIHFK